MDSQFSSIDLYVCHYVSTILSWFLLVFAKLFFFKNIFAILGPLHFYMKFRASWSNSAKKKNKKDCFNSVNEFWEYHRFNSIKSFDPWTQNVFPFI